MSITKKILCLMIVVAVVIPITVIPVQAEYIIPNEYWKYQQPYINASRNKNYDDIITYGTEIIRILKNEPLEQRMPMLISVYEDIYYAYELREDYDKAAEYLNEFLKCAAYFNYDVSVKMGKIVLNHLDVGFEVYALSTDTSNVPYYGMRAEPKNGTYVGRVMNDESTATPPTDDESILSFYARLDMEDTFQQFDYLIKQYSGTDRVLHFAMNLMYENDSLQGIIDGLFDEKIINDLKYINTHKNPTMLRIFAEMNVWPIPADPSLFKQAYLKVASLARIYAPNTALVFAPNIISHIEYDIDDYYPGDDYVDWVGVSLYSHLYFNPDQPEPFDKAFAEAFYYAGKYSHPIVMVRDIVDRYGDKKPIMITEGAPGSKIKSTGLDLTDYAKKSINQMYSYINMKYPQVKAVIFFDKDLPLDRWSYSLNNNRNVSDQFFTSITQNKALNNGIKSSDYAYKILNTFSEVTNTLNLYTYAVFPNNNITQVDYYIDGKFYTASITEPYNVSIDIGMLSVGGHTLDVVLSNGSYQRKKEYELSKSDGNKIICVSKTTARSIQGNVINAVRNTDIVAYIEGVEIPSYNINAKTCIFVADLANYGFNVEYNDLTRIANISKKSGVINPSQFVPVPRGAMEAGMLGEKLYDVISTDIIVYVNDIKVQNFLVNNRNMIYLTDLAPYCNIKYDESTRSVSVTFK